MHLQQDGDKLLILDGTSRVIIEPWGVNSLRVRMTKEPRMNPNDWALSESVKNTDATITFEEIDVTDPWYEREQEYIDGVRQLTSGQTVTVPAPLDIIPVMVREGKQYDIYE